MMLDAAQSQLKKKRKKEKDQKYLFFDGQH